METEQVRAIARQAGLELTDDEVSEFAGQLGSILDRFAAIEEADRENDRPPPGRTEPATALRRDSPAPGFPPGEALKEAGETTEDSFLVPRVLKEGR